MEGLSTQARSEKTGRDCARACISALGRPRVPLRRLFPEYDDAGIRALDLQTVETFVLDALVSAVEPTHRTAADPAARGQGATDRAETRHMAYRPGCLDIDSGRAACPQHHLYDELSTLHARDGGDYVEPVWRARYNPQGDCSSAAPLPREAAWNRDSEP